jgi:hypothetical protein
MRTTRIAIPDLISDSFILSLLDGVKHPVCCTSASECCGLVRGEEVCLHRLKR